MAHVTLLVTIPPPPVVFTMYPSSEVPNFVLIPPSTTTNRLFKFLNGHFHMKQFRDNYENFLKNVFYSHKYMVKISNFCDWCNIVKKTTVVTYHNIRICIFKVKDKC